MSFTDKLKKLEEEKQKIIEKRQQEILKIITDTGALDIDNRILASVLLFLKNPANKEHSFMKELASVTTGKAKTPSRASKEVELITA